MNFKKTALGGFSHVRDHDLLVRSKTIMLAMSSSVYFPDPQPHPGDMETHLQDFQEKLSICRSRGTPQDTAAKNAARLILVEDLRQLAFYVSKTAHGDLQVLLSSGFELSNIPKTRDIPEQVQGVVLSDGKQTGQMRLDFEKQPKVLLYQYRYAVDEGGKTSEWSEPFATTASRANILAPLHLYVRHYVQVRAVNSAGKSEWSEAVSHVTR